LLSAPPRIIDSTMYLLSGVETCLKVMPACSVTSVKRVPVGWLDAAPPPGSSESDKTINAASRLSVLTGKLA
jgi:hypothetical protein